MPSTNGINCFSFGKLSQAFHQSYPLCWLRARNVRNVRTSWAFAPWCFNRISFRLFAVGIMLGQFVIDLLYDDRYAGAGIILSIFMGRLMIRGIGQLQFQHLLARGEVKNATFAYGVALAVQFAVFYPLVVNFGGAGLAISGLISTTVLTVSQALFTNREVTKTCPVMRPVIGTACWMMVPMLAISLWS